MDGLKVWTPDQGSPQGAVVSALLANHSERRYRWPRKKSVQALKDKIREKTKRTNGHSLACSTAAVNGILKGWFAYFKHSHWTSFKPLDSWTRMRLRSILRKRTKRQRRGRGWDHIRWTNAFFAARGLFTLVTAHAAVPQSRCGNH